MLSNILKWAFKVGEKEAHLFLDNDTSLEAVKDIAYQIIKHCGTIEDQQKSFKMQQEAEAKAKEAVVQKVEPIAQDNQPPPVVD
jgi:hypothetical protein